MNKKFTSKYNINFLLSIENKNFNKSKNTDLNRWNNLDQAILQYNSKKYTKKLINISNPKTKIKNRLGIKLQKKRLTVLKPISKTFRYNNNNIKEKKVQKLSPKISSKNFTKQEKINKSLKIPKISIPKNNTKPKIKKKMILNF